MTPQELRDRTKRFAVDVIRFVRSLPQTEEGRIISRQLLRAGTSVGANYRAACRSKSDPLFIDKLGYVIEEADESGYWIEILVETGNVTAQDVEAISGEAEALTKNLRRLARDSTPPLAREAQNHKSQITNHK